VLEKSADFWGDIAGHYSGLILSDSTAGEGYTHVLMEVRIKISASEWSLPDFETSGVYKH
jgi:hypothetical protein